MTTYRHPQATARPDCASAAGRGGRTPTMNWKFCLTVLIDALAAAAVISIPIALVYLFGMVL